MSFQRQALWKSGWGKPLLRGALLCAGGAALIAWAVLLVIAVFTEPGTEDPTDNWLAVGMIVSCVVAGLTLTFMVTNPGWRIGAAGAFIAVGCGIAAGFVYAAMPDPGAAGFIAHRQALAAVGFGFGFVGGGLLVLGEMATDGKVPSPRWRPPSDLSLRVNVVAVSIVVLAGSTSVPAMHDWTDAANADTTRASAPAPEQVNLNLAETRVSGTASGGLGTPGGLLTLDESGEDAAIAVTMWDAGTGVERWHHRHWNRTAVGEPVPSADGSVVALAGIRRDDTSVRYTTLLDTNSGKRIADIRMKGDPGSLQAVTSDTVVYKSGDVAHELTARDLNGQVRWTYQAPSDCAVSMVEDDGPQMILALACRADTSTKDRARVVALDSHSGERQWQWDAEAVGQIHSNGMVVTEDLVIVDVRRDDSANDSLFAARKYRHDLTAISVADGSQEWRKKKVDLGDTFAPACAGTLQLAGRELETGRVVLGECHQEAGKAGATFDVTAYRLEDGKRTYEGGAVLGYAPTRDNDTSQWFAGLPDGRTVMTADASSDLNEPECRMYVLGPTKEDDREKLPVPEDLDKTAWCQGASIHLTPNSLAVTYPTGANPEGKYFAFG